MATTAETGKRTKRDELLELLRDEWKRGFDNRVVMGGMRALQAEYGPFVPPEVFAALRHYSTLDAAGRKQALTLAGKILSAPPDALTPGPSPARRERGVVMSSVDRIPRAPITDIAPKTSPKPKSPPAVKPMSLSDEVMYLRGVGPKNA
ncbi:MAG: hypothetical protein ACR2M3_02265, partial [Thermomicrobiales bacterium]